MRTKGLPTSADVLCRILALDPRGRAARKDVTAVLVALLLVAATATAQNSWRWLNPNPSGHLMHAVDFLDSLSGYAAGFRGNLIRTTDGGRTWSLLPTGFTAQLNGVAHRGASSVTAVGTGGLIIATTDAGAGWSRQDCGIVTDLRAVSFSDAMHGVVVGDRGVALRTSDGGAMWVRVTFDQSRNFTDVQMITERLVVAVIASGDTMYRSVDGGATWSPLGTGRKWKNNAVHFVDGDRGFIASAYGLLRTTDAGSTWTLVTGQTPLRDVCFSDHLHGACLMEAGRQIMVTSDGGDTWWNSTAGYISEMYTIGAINSSTFIAMGRSGRILRSTDGGAVFTCVSGIHNNVVQEQPDIFLRSVAAVDSQRFIAVGSYGVMLTSTDAGGSWVQVAHYPQALKKIEFLNDSLGIVVGSTSNYLRTTDGGRTWSTWMIPNADDLMAVSIIDSRCIYVADLRVMRRTTDGGGTWEQIDLPGRPYLVDGDFCDSLNGLAGSKDGVLYRTTDGGATWSQDTLGKAMEEVFVACISPELGYAAVKDAIYRMDASGKSWRRISAIGSAASFTDICFADALHGAAVSEVGIAVRTSDGGITWSAPEQIFGSRLWGIAAVDGGNFITVGFYGAILVTRTDTPAGLDDVPASPFTSRLGSPYPHPSPHGMFFPITLREPGRVTLKVYTMLGQEIALVLHGRLEAGTHIARWDPSDIAAGAYLAVLRAEGGMDVRRVLLAK